MTQTTKTPTAEQLLAALYADQTAEGQARVWAAAKRHGLYLALLRMAS